MDSGTDLLDALRGAVSLVYLHERTVLCASGIKREWLYNNKSALAQFHVHTGVSLP